MFRRSDVRWNIGNRGAVRRQLGEFPQQERTNVPVMLPLMRWLRWCRRTIQQARSNKRDKKSAGDGTLFIPFIGK
nr:hypothetical protein [Frisingicoccus sp.]